jgi:C4-dicarboxylate-specific signal transduction histidine kinase
LDYGPIALSGARYYCPIGAFFRCRVRQITRESTPGTLASVIAGMLRRNKHLYTLLCVALSIMPNLSALADASHTVVVLYSDERSLPANIEGDRGLRAALMSPGAGRVDVYDEYFDQPHFGSSAGYEQTIFNYLHDKFALHPPDIFIVAGNDALGFAIRNRARLFPQVPIVHMGVDKSFLLEMSHKPVDLVGVPVDDDIVGTIDQALRWHPLAQRLVVVTGAAPYDRDWEMRIRSAAAHLSLPVKIEYLGGLPAAKLLPRLSTLGLDTIVFTPGYYEDGDGLVTTPRKSVELMAQASSAPMYGPYNTFIGAGVVGGSMPTFESMGHQAGTIAMALIGGTSPAALKLPQAAPHDMHVDWREIQRWGIDQSQLPKGTILHYRTPSLWEAYRKETIAGATAILLLAGLSILLLNERRSLERTSAALKMSERRMTLAARAAKLAMWMWNEADDRLSITPARPVAPSGDRAEIRLADALAEVHPADRDATNETVQKALSTGRELDLEYRTLAESDEVRWTAVRGRSDSENPRQWLGVVLDITDRKRAELQAEQDRVALAHMTRVSMLGQLSASIAHQLNQPLTAILANAEAAQQMLREEPVDLIEMREICDDIVSQDQRAATVIRRLSALFKHRELQSEPVDVNALFRETVELVRTDLITGHITVISQLSDGIDFINGDKIQLQQVLLNLIINAAEAMRSIPTVMRQLTIRSEATQSEVQLQVIDNGPGIALKDLDHVFEPFWSAKPSGMGIGLSVCQSIVAAHHGTLSVSNNRDGGATFSVVIPARRTQ